MRKIHDHIAGPYGKVLLVGALLVTLILCVVLPLLFESRGVCSSSFANFGQWISGWVGVAGVPALLLTLYFQAQAIADERKIREYDDAEKTFENHCRSIEYGLGYVKNLGGTVEGGAAIIRYGELRENGTMDFNAIANELSVDALKAVISALSDLLDWVKRPQNSFKFHNFFRVRFMGLIMGFEKMLPPGAKEMTEGQILTTYGDEPQRHSLILAMHRLYKKELEVWTRYQREVNSVL